MMKMIPVGRLLLAISFVLALCGSASAAQSASRSHKPAAHSHKSHPSHPMRNNRSKHHVEDSTRTSLLAVRYLQPQQASSVVAAKSSAYSSPASSKKKKSSSKKSRRSWREPTQKAPTPERISEIQSSLARGGYYQGDPNGKWDSNTVAAMQKFQSANGLDPSGKLDATSLQKLGLGSGIAGVSAPKQAAPAQGKSCCSNSPSGTGPATSAPAAPAAAPKPSSEPSASASPSASSGTDAAASASSPAVSASAATSASDSSQR